MKIKLAKPSADHVVRAAQEREEFLQDEPNEGLAKIHLGKQIQKLIKCTNAHFANDKCPSSPHFYLGREWCCACFMKALIVADRGIRASTQKENNMKVPVAEPRKEAVHTNGNGKSPAKPAKSAKGATLAAPMPRRMATGKRLKLGINMTWVHLFQKNETLAKSGKALKDADITEYMYAEFPGRKSEVFKAVSSVRSRYNRGVLTNGDVPKIQSNPHNKKEEKKPKGKK